MYLYGFMIPFYEMLVCEKRRGGGKTHRIVKILNLLHKPDHSIAPTITNIILLRQSQTMFRAFIDKDDDEFVDEPLSSPRLHTEEEPTQPERTEEPHMTTTPLSPTSALTEQVQAFDLEPDTPMVDVHTEEKSAPSPPAEKKPIEPESVASEPILAQEPMEEMSPEDKPAPLFAKKSEPSPEVPTEQAPASNASIESMDTTMGEAGDSSSSVLMNSRGGRDTRKGVVARFGLARVSSLPLLSLLSLSLIRSFLFILYRIRRIL
ncbi:hypothetical protein B0J14DRAFT_288535 [Halenospora varia]|nr:hypothetical protein B0J14DRAFT_288535 [Halenospora varia]